MSQRSILRSNPDVASVLAVGAPGEVTRGNSHVDRSDTNPPVSMSTIRQVWRTRFIINHRDLGPVRMKGQRAERRWTPKGAVASPVARSYTTSLRL